MKPHPRLRRAALVSGAVVTVLLVAVWIASAWWSLEVWTSRSVPHGISSGAAYWSYQDPDLALDIPKEEVKLWRVYRDPSAFGWWFERRYWAGWGLIRAPLWLPAGATMLGTAAVWRLDARARRRARVGACAKCGYDRAGLAPEATCPECGTNPGRGGGQP